MSLKVADRIAHLPDYPFVAIDAEIRKLQKEGKNILKLTMGSPDLPAPPWVIEKLAQSASQPNKHGYSSYTGTPEFRQAIARYYKKQFAVELDADKEILPLIGSKEGLANITLALAGPGDVVLTPSPAYPTYEQAAILAQADTYIMPLEAKNRFLPDLDTIPADILKRAKMMWVDYPNNPTGALATVDDYKKMVEFCKQHGIMLMSDNPYFAIVFDDTPPTSALQVPGAKENTVEFMSLSKSHNMAGWRLGAAVGNREAIAALLTVKSNVDSGHFLPVYEAGVVALDETPDSWIKERNQVYTRRAKILIDAMEDIGLTLDAPPKGSIYLWPRVLDGDDAAYAKEALHEAGVAVVPGFTYGEAGRGYIRISLVLTEDKVAEAVERLKKWYAAKKK